jgi:hypothetical protein
VSARVVRADSNDRVLAIERCQAERFGAPTLADYRQDYETSGWQWPGDHVIRRDYPKTAIAAWATAAAGHTVPRFMPH